MLSSSLDLRSFQALINGLVKKNFYGNEEFTIDYLREQLYPSTELEASEVVNEISSFEEVRCSSLYLSGLELVVGVENCSSSQLGTCEVK